MSQDNGQTSVIRKMASRLRGDGELQEETPMRDEEGQGSVGGSTSPTATESNHRIPKAPNQAPAKASAAISWGVNSQLPHHEVLRAILERLQVLSEGGAQRVQVPPDILGFLQKATVVFLDHQGKPVEFERVVVAWEE